VTKRVLLDESVPRHLAAPLEAAGFSATPYPNDWKQTKNGELLTLAEERGFDVLVTNDRSIYAQQNLRGRQLAIVVLPTNLRRQIMQRAAAVADTVGRIKPGQYVVIEPSGQRTVIDYNSPDAKPAEMPSVEPFEFRSL
jgi:predicted nuclease of predicted toxin-antitoxin system